MGPGWFPSRDGNDVRLVLSVPGRVGRTGSDSALGLAVERHFPVEEIGRESRRLLTVDHDLRDLAVIGRGAAYLERAVG